MLDCKKALDEAEGDFDKAVEIIRVKGQKGVTKREGRATSNGLVTAKAEADFGVMLELNCETDFVAKGERFQERVDEGNATLGEKIEIKRISVLTGSPVALYLHKTSPDLPAQVGVLVQLKNAAAEAGRDIAQHIAAFAPQYVSRDQVPADLIDTERRLAEETARNEGKPEASISKIVEGRVTGFVKEVSLLEQSFAKDAKKTVQQILDEAKTAVSAFNRFRVGQ